jgi:UDP:flavonoid glycosyltransferase YjiC (YdhE family)
VTIGPAALTPEAVRDAVRLVLEDPSYRDAGQRLAAELAALPAPAEVARTLRGRIAGR